LLPCFFRSKRLLQEGGLAPGCPLAGSSLQLGVILHFRRVCGDSAVVEDRPEKASP
jgi:hypothetical protein